MMNLTEERRSLRIEQIELQQELQRRQATRRFYDFFRLAWSSIWSAHFKDNWHFEYLCDRIEVAARRVLRGEKREKDLCINVPPGTAKSTIISICLNAWVWILDPSKRFLTTSYAPELAGDHAKATRKLINSEWYQSLFGNIYKLVGNAETFFETDHGGRRMTTSPGSQVGTGFHADFIIFDDPDAAAKVYSEAQRNETTRWQDEVMPSRLADPEVGLRIMVQQRLHQKDSTGHVKKNFPDKWDFVVLPGILTQDVYPVELSKRYVGGLLFPTRLGPLVIEDYRRRLRNGFAGQILMTPLSEGGNVFKESHPVWYNKEQLPILEEIIVSVDGSFTGAKTSCPVSIQVWGKKRPNYYFIHELTQRMGAIESETAIDRILRIYPGSMAVIEKAANGYFLIEKLKKKYRVYEFDPRKYGGKEVRADMVVPIWETGNVWLHESQHNREYYWPELLMFPNGEYKDRVDAMSQALIYLARIPHGKGGAADTGGY